MEVTQNSIDNNLDMLLKSDHLIINENINLDNNIWKKSLVNYITFGYYYNQPITKICDKINVFGKYIKKYSNSIICNHVIINNNQYDLRYIYDIGYVFQDDYEYYRNIMKTLLLIRNNILEYNNEYSNISNLPNELIQYICKFIL